MQKEKSPRHLSFLDNTELLKGLAFINTCQTEQKKSNASDHGSNLWMYQQEGKKELKFYVKNKGTKVDLISTLEARGRLVAEAKQQGSGRFKATPPTAGRGGVSYSPGPNFLVCKIVERIKWDNGH